ncbi:hypothetical protein CMUS01_09008 [Colletotrichum musicola]|uniref:Uncharacterized protein n=1 Tax=Colletotrichum musicola TaxID=2175873 RepID=A0A8H6KB43_9PEZI|nr:hypothetical protein CMUS01_09008 [Colletotrichum musicola]
MKVDLCEGGSPRATSRAEGPWTAEAWWSRRFCISRPVPHRTASPVEEVGRNGEKQTAAYSLLADVTELRDVMTESRTSLSIRDGKEGDGPRTRQNSGLKTDTESTPDIEN